ncbi:putative non-specific lipid-transfer protein 14 [Malania oleifera]|uniref:putative non-specific lipid-transfer protein 14 n=1 Tax=Malania oleifera TaxID=397392 RepID=UPI0025AE0FC5|nr:putative non-specific lipid-transfer protein 14 [Malania oleifera]
MGFHETGVGRCRTWAVIGLLLMWPCYRAAAASSPTVCPTVTALLSACSTFISYGLPEPLPGSACCDAVTAMNAIGEDSSDNRRSICRCLLGLVITYDPNATAIATLPGFCGVSLGFNINPNTDCSIVQ